MTRATPAVLASLDVIGSTSTDAKRLELRIPPLAELTPEAVSDFTLEDVKKLELIYSISKKGLSEDERQRLACALFIIHRDGIRDKETNEVILDEDLHLKADFYLAEALCFTPPDPPAYFFLRFLARFTSIRLAIVRCFRLNPLRCLDLATSSGALFYTLQLSYFAEFVFCLSLLVEKSLRPKTEKDEWWWQRLEWHRFKIALSDRELMSTLTNAIIWGVVNGVCVFDHGLTPAGRALWNLAGFFLDFVHDVYYAHKDSEDYKGLKKSIDDGFQIDGINLKNPAFQTNLTTKINKLDYKEKRLAIAAGLIFVGMSMVFAPVLVPWLSAHVSSWMAFYLLKLTTNNLTYLKKIGAGVVIFAGVYLAGLGGKLFHTNYTWGNFREMMLLPLVSTGALTLTMLLSPSVPLFVLASSALMTAALTLLILATTGKWSEWFNEKTRHDFLENFAKTAIAPLFAVGTLMLLATAGCSITFLLSATCTMLGAAFVLMQWNWISFESKPKIKQTSTISLFPNARLFVTPEKVNNNNQENKDADNTNKTGILQINKLCQMSQVDRDFLQNASELDNHSSLRALKNWSIPVSKREPSSMTTIMKMLDACDGASSISPRGSRVALSLAASDPSPSPTDEKKRSYASLSDSTNSITNETDSHERPPRKLKPHPPALDLNRSRSLQHPNSLFSLSVVNLNPFSCCQDDANETRANVEPLTGVR